MSDIDFFRIKDQIYSTLIEKSAGISCQFFLQSSFSAKIGFDDISKKSKNKDSNQIKLLLVCAFKNYNTSDSKEVHNVPEIVSCVASK